MADRKGILLFSPFEERRLFNQGRFRTTWKSPWAIQRKLDGERCRAIVQGGRCILLSASEELLMTVPHINQYLADNFPDGEYDGEIYKHGWSQEKIHSVLWTTTRVHEQAHMLEFHIFDEKTSGEIQATRLLNIKNYPYGGPVHLVEAYICHTLDDIMNYYDQFIAEGYEGFILRELSGYYKDGRTQLGMKFKPKKADAYSIIAPFEAITEDGTPKGMIGGFMCIDDMGSIFKVAAGNIKHSDRIRLWQMFLDGVEFKGKQLIVAYQCLTNKNKVPRHGRATKSPITTEVI